MLELSCILMSLGTTCHMPGFCSTVHLMSGTGAVLAFKCMIVDASMIRLYVLNTQFMFVPGMGKTIVVVALCRIAGVCMISALTNGMYQVSRNLVLALIRLSTLWCLILQC